jgi:hypothetical protein
MSGRVDADPDALERLRDSLLTIQDQQLEALDQIGNGATEVLDALESEVVRCHAEVGEAQEELERCRELQAVAAAQGAYVDCSSKERALEEAERRLQTAQAALQAAEAANAEYQQAAYRHRAYLDEAIPTMRVGLERRAQSLEAYLAWSVQQRRGVDLASVGAARGGFGGQRTGIVGSNTPVSKMHRDVPLELVEEPEFAPGEWAQADEADMRASFRQLPSVQQAIAKGTVDGLIEADPGARRVYDWFYGSEAVRLDWYQGKYTITNGKHRIELARRLGLSYIPAVVTGRD